MPADNPFAVTAPAAAKAERGVVGHTPGEWLVQSATVYTLQPAGFRRGEELFANRFSAQVQVGYDRDGNATPTAELEANARLIAAAPDLLALAQGYEAWEGDLVLNGDWRDATVRMSQAQHDRLMELQAERNRILASIRHDAALQRATAEQGT